MGNNLKSVELQDYLLKAATKLNHTRQKPYGYYPKATYKLYFSKNGSLLYSFTTTIHSVDECIEIMKQRWNSLNYWPGYYSITRIVDGIEQTLFKHNYDSTRKSKRVS